jgi:1,4-alpha-glucan branching enzyme
MAVLNFMVHSPAGYVARNHIDGVRFEATDLEWNSGTDGLAVRGTADALMRVMSGRPAALDELEGDGVEVLRARG